MKSLHTRSFRVGGYSVAAGAMILGMAVAANVFINALPATMTQLDMTSNQLFSISDQTEKIISGLDQDITVYWIVQNGQEDETIQTLLSRYQALSDKVDVVKKDPDVYPTFVQKYTSSGVYNNSLIVEAGERNRYIAYDEIYQYDYSNYYTTYTYDVSFAGESELTSAIDYVISEDIPKTYFLSGHGETALDSSFESVIGKQNIETDTLSLINVEAIPEDADCILICAPQNDIAEQEKEMLLDYLADGGHVFLITALPEDGELENLAAVMEAYGVSAVDGVVVEGSQSNYAWGMPYYLLPNLNSHAITSALIEEQYYVLLPVAQGLSVADELPEGVTVTELLTTSSSAYSKAAGFALETYDKEEGDTDGPFALAVAVEKELTEDKKTQIVWASTSSLVDSQVNQQVAGGNQDFFLNALQWMCSQKEEELAIHPKALTTDYLTMDSGKASIFTLIIVGIIPICYLAAGIRIWFRRKRR